MSEVNRRDFMKTAGAAGAFMIAQGINVKSYAQNDKVQVACIGTGGQGTFHVRTGLAGTENIQIVGIADVFAPHQKSGRLYGQISNAKVMMGEGQRFSDLDPDTQAKVKAAPRPEGFYDYKEMLATMGDQIDAVVIATPLHTHYQISMDCLDAGKFVFCEKTLVQTIEQGRNLVTKCHETGKFVQVGHQRRYNPKYNMAMDFVYGKGYLGRITHITAQWHRNNNWRRNWQEEYGADYQLNDDEKKFIPDLEKHLNWRMYNDTSGGLFTELATHQTDVANWFLQTPPSRVHTFAGLDYWRDGRDVADNIVLAYEYNIKPGDPGFITIDTRSQLQDPSKVNKSYTVRFVYTSILANQKRGASEMIQGDNGTLELSETVCKFYAEPVWTEAPPKKKEEGADTKKEEGDDASSIVTGGTLLTPEQMKALAEGKELLGTCDILPADIYQFEAFAHHVKNGGTPRTNQMVGLTTAIGAIAAIQSMQEKRTVEIDPAWYTFDFEVPPFAEYEFDITKYNCKEEPKPEEKKDEKAPA